MERRNAMKVGIGALAGTGIGLFTLTNAFRNKNISNATPSKLKYDHKESNHIYTTLNPEITAEIAYKQYSNGGCMYAIVGSVVSQ
jgi:hypothetical protein